MLADMTIVYAQNVGPQQFAVIYKALYRDGILGNLSVQPVSDNGKWFFISLKLSLNFIKS